MKRLIYSSDLPLFLPAKIKWFARFAAEYLPLRQVFIGNFKVKLLYLTCCAIALSLPLPAAAQSLLEGGQTRGPIEITADELEVRQPDQVAVFNGNVIAVQGTLNLKSDKMTVHYREGSNTTEGQESISKIIVDGNVFLSNPAETASGNQGVYDVDQDEIHLTGNVTLTRDKNILKGSTLVYNMSTGKSVLTNAGGTQPASKRVRALFVPEKKEK